MSEIVWLPDSDAVLREIEPICPLLWDAIEAGTVDAAHYFGRKKRNPFDASFYPTFVRYRIKTYLRALGLAACDEEEDTDLGMRPLPNLGLQLKYRDYEIRIRKSDGVDGREVPPAGPSAKTQDYYRQAGQEHLYLPFPERELQVALGGVNLFALWVPNTKHRLENILLALTKNGGTTLASVQTHWVVSLPRPLVAAAHTEHGEDLTVTPASRAADDVASHE